MRVRACVRACTCVCACVRVCVRACVCGLVGGLVSGWLWMSEHFQNIRFSSYRALRRHKSRADCYNWVYVTLLDFFFF